MRMSRLLPVALAVLATSGPGHGQLPRIPSWVTQPLPEPDLTGPADLDRNLESIARSTSEAPDAFDAQLAAAILADLRTLPATRRLTGAQRDDGRLPRTVDLPDDAPAGLAVLGGGRISGPLVIDWSQQLGQTELAGNLGLSQARGPLEIRFDLQSRVPLAKPLVPNFSYNTSAYLRVLPMLKVGAVASGPLDARAGLRGQSIGPEAKLSLPGLGGSLDAEAGWRLPSRDGQSNPGSGPAGGRPGELQWSLSYRKPL